MMAVTYMVICLCDFILFPVLWTAIQFWRSAPVNNAPVPWTPLTLQASGFIHVTFMAILGVAAWTRGMEKIEAIKANRGDDA
jgi:hypothetical protein